MKSPRFALAILILLVGATFVFPQLALKEFKPPRVAVVDSFEVIKQYKKKDVLEAGLEGEFKDAYGQVSELERKFKELEAELKIVEEGTPEHRALLVRRTELEYDVKKFRATIGKQLDDKRIEAVQEIREEVEAEIVKYAEANELDIVLEKKIPIDGRGALKMNIPIVRFVRPEIEVTDEIARILNERYRQITKSESDGGAPARSAAEKDKK